MHRFIDFKSFANAEVDLFTPWTILIGKNGSGKSNAIEAIELLSQIAHGRPLHEISDVGRGGDFEVRGGLAGCVREGRERFTLEFEFTMPFDGQTRPCAYSVSLRAAPEARIAAESLVVGDRTFFTTEEGSERLESGVVKVRHDNFSRGPNKPRVTLAADRSVLSQYEIFAASEKHTSARELVASLRAYLRAAFVFDPIPAGMRQYDRIGNRILGRRGGNLSPVLYALSTGNPNDKQSLARILGWIKQLPEEPYESFAFVPTALGDVMFGFRERAGGPIVDARVLSDGTLRSLAILTALETAKEDSLVVIEEFDNGLHSSRAALLAQAVGQVAEERKLKVLTTTHNAATLNSLTPEQMKGVVLAFVDKEQAASRLVPLLSLPRADVLLERGRLGDLVTRQILDQHLEPDLEEKVRERTLAWLKAMP